MRPTYKTWFWLLVTILVINSIFTSLTGGPGDADELVLKRELPRGGWLYITRYGAFATDLDTLRFYISEPLKGDDIEILQQLNTANKFLVTDSEIKEVEVTDTTNGVHIKLQGAVYQYFSKQYLGKGEDLTSYRITLSQSDDSPVHQ
jgi:hypothetical protein